MTTLAKAGVLSCKMRRATSQPPEGVAATRYETLGERAPFCLLFWRKKVKRRLGCPIKEMCPHRSAEARRTKAPRHLASDLNSGH